MTIRLMKFIFTGGTAAGVEYIVFLGLHFFLGPSWIFLSQTISFLCGFLVSFLLNRSWVFSNKTNTRLQLVKYTILACFNLVLTNGILWILVDKIGVHYLVAKIIVMAMVATWNYFFFSRLIFVNKLD